MLERYDVDDGFFIFFFFALERCNYFFIKPSPTPASYLLQLLLLLTISTHFFFLLLLNIYKSEIFSRLSLYVYVCMRLADELWKLLSPHFYCRRRRRSKKVYNLMLKTCWEFMCASIFSSHFANFTAVEFLFITWMSSGYAVLWVCVCACVCSFVQSLAAWSTYRLLFAASLVLTFMPLCCCYSFSCRYAIKISKFTWSSSVLSSAVTTQRQWAEFQQLLCTAALRARSINFCYYNSIHTSHIAGEQALAREAIGRWHHIHNQLWHPNFTQFYILFFITSKCA